MLKQSFELVSFFLRIRVLSFEILFFYSYELINVMKGVLLLLLYISKLLMYAKMCLYF